MYFLFLQMYRFNYRRGVGKKIICAIMNFTFSWRLLLQFINGNKRGKRNVLQGNGIWQTTSELITTTSFAQTVALYFYRIKRSNQKHSNRTARHFPFLWRRVKSAGKRREISLAVPSPSHINE